MSRVFVRRVVAMLVSLALVVIPFTSYAEFPKPTYDHHPAKQKTAPKKAKPAKVKRTKAKPHAKARPHTRTATTRTRAKPAWKRSSPKKAKPKAKAKKIARPKKR